MRNVSGIYSRRHSLNRKYNLLIILFITVSVSGADDWPAFKSECYAIDQAQYTASLKVTKIANTTGPVGPGDQIEYEIKICNIGEVNVTNVTVYDDLLEGSPYPIPGTLSPGLCKNVTNLLVYSVTDADLCNGSIVNVAEVTAEDCYGNMITETGSSPMILTEFDASFEIKKTANVSEATLGDVIGYDIFINNTGNVMVYELKLEDDITGEIWSVCPPPLAPGENRTLNTSYTVKESDLGDLITNTLFVTGYVGPCGPIDVRKSASATVSTTNSDKHNDVPNLSVTKIALQKTVEGGDDVEYLINIRSDIDKLHNVTVKDVFDNPVEFVSGSPMPDADGIWRFAKVDVKDLPKDENDPDWRTLITLTVKVPDKQDFEYDMAQGVAGAGFVNVKNDYRTTYESYVITNCIELTTDTIPGEVFKDCESVTVMIDPGTELSTREHGSGLYESEELVRMRTENKSISMDKDMAATYSPTTLGLYHNRTVTYSSRWTEEAKAKNRVTGTSMSERYMYATTIDRESSFFLDENQSVMNIDSEFDGMGHIGFLKMPSSTSTAHDTPTIEMREDYVGSFKVLERVDEYGAGVSNEKAANGSGFAVGDRRVKDSQRSYESGTGTYDSEEIIETATNYIAKDISLVYAPMNQSLTDDVSISASQKWKEGMYSTTPGTSYIGEEFTSLDYLDKETIAKGINEMNTEASFEGRARFRALFEPNKGDPEVDMDEQYEGDYSIERHVLFTGVPKYDRPHLNVTKTLESLVEVDDPCEENEGECTSTRQVANYTITIENDGNVALEPVYVTDYFPPGAVFLLPSSLRPEVLTDKYANWTLTHMNIGDVVTITLSLDVTNYHPDELVNRVDVCGVYDNETVCARNFSALEIDWLTCCVERREEQLSVVKTGEINPENQSVVHYRIEIGNAENVTRVATVTDWLPDSMDLIDSSTSVASYDGSVVVWNLVEIGPSETKTIEFSALVPGSGRFTNTVQVDPRSIDGPVVQLVRATCVIDVGVVEGESGPVSCDAWQPPNWEFEHRGYEPDETTCEQLTCTDCDGTDSCLAP